MNGHIGNIIEGQKGNLGVRIVDNYPNQPWARLIRNVTVTQLSDFTFKVMIDFNMDPMVEASCLVSTCDGWSGVDFMNDVNQPNFSTMDVMFKWMGEGKSDMEIQWSTWSTGDETDKDHFPSLFVSEILVTQVQVREEFDEMLVLTTDRA